MIRLLFVIDGLGHGGKERQLIEILRGLDSSAIESGIISFNKDGHYSPEAKNLTQGNYFEIDKKKSKISPFIEVNKIISNIKPDIVHTWDTMSSMYAYPAARLNGCKFIDGSIRDAGVESGWQFYYKKTFLKLADICVANQQAGLNYYGVPGKLIYNSLDLSRFKAPQRNGEFNLIMVANFTDYKDHRTFINAGGKLLAENIVDNVYLVGHGIHEAKYREYIITHFSATADRFIFTGAVKNVEEYLSKCSIGVLCSTSQYGEGLSNSVIEYMAAGLVPVVTDIGGSSEIITHGKDGYLFAEGDSNALYTYVRKIREDENLFNQLSESALKTVSEKFNYKINNRTWQELYQNLLSEKLN